MRNFSDILRDLTDANRRDYALVELREIDTLMQKIESWTRFFGADPTFQTLRARHGDFEVAPIDAIIAERSLAQSIPNNTITDISFQARTPNTKTFSTVPGDDTRVNLLQARGALGVFGTVQWATNGVGRRGVHLDIYDQFNTKLSGATLHSLLPTGIASDTIPYAGYFITASAPKGAYLRFSVVQTSGGALNMEFFRGGLFALI